MFALCFGSVEGDGALMLGDADVAGRFNVALQYTPLLSNPAHPHYYSVALEALVVGGEALDVKAVRHPRHCHGLQIFKNMQRRYTGCYLWRCVWQSTLVHAHWYSVRWGRSWSAASRKV